MDLIPPTTTTTTTTTMDLLTPTTTTTTTTITGVTLMALRLLIILRVRTIMIIITIHTTITIIIHTTTITTITTIHTTITTTITTIHTTITTTTHTTTTTTIHTTTTTTTHTTTTTTTTTITHTTTTMKGEPMLCLCLSPQTMQGVTHTDMDRTEEATATLSTVPSRAHTVADARGQAQAASLAVWRAVASAALNTPLKLARTWLAASGVAAAVSRVVLITAPAPEHAITHTTPNSAVT